MRVFIADDSEILRERLVENLSQLPNVNVVGEAKDVTTAKQLIDEIEFDIALYDIKMPNGSGIELIEHTKMKNPSAKIIMMTNYSIDSYKNKCLEEGADYFFDKSNLDEALLLIEKLSVDE
ncbi:MAG: response regulator transcription factor [Candidatus Marinimicrobia bacterium]|nr:response regulator transcription factor [Candidatus Neomarinimicrobiota bacterium]